MREGPSARALASAVDWDSTVSSWLGGTVLANVIPARGRVTADVSRQVPETLKLTVPRFSVEDGRRVDWKPSDPASPLARFGQRLDATISAEGVDARIGRYLITDWQEQGGTIAVTAAGILQVPADDRLPRSLAPRDDGTLKSEFLRLLPPQVQAQFAPSLVDRACPKAMEWPESRIDALYEIADAWPARLRTDGWGQLQLLPPLPAVASPVLKLTDGENGTVVSAPTSDSRGGGYNRVVVRSSAPGVSAQAVAEVTSGPMSVNGPYGAVTKFWSSPRLLNEAQCLAAAQQMLADAVRQSRVLKVEMAPDPRIDLDDPVEVIVDKGTDEETRYWGYVIGYELPLTVADGPMRIDVGIL